MKHISLTFALAAATLLAPWAAHAEKADRLKPMNIEADALRYDDASQTSVFTGRVVATKGTIVVRGARIEVKQDPEGFHTAIVTAAPGQQAFWRQKRDGVDEFMEGEAETIEYDGRADRVKFIGKAEMRRYRGEALADETSGNLITYDNAREVFTVDGAAGAQGATASNPGGRVRATLAPPPNGKPAPAVPAASLRPSTTVGGERR
ncbi:lipopolysaccharide transport periplasmic protein LptA [Ramlibacter rhizophilus]|uniref:Lipopolysaccharide export system protein LptA n=1 Tax=Ramlibacter rhizophilus TaxID=1781167 RepID=A0A4Z0BI73_9BURK|nr:lipopolysaccharide transport periplasmic protein LptA [Ramlibacter rhizophilus]TFY98109.1 lipopolysaccharide transport periplasmic protein LptA [Ramlibacter rhizophilus]